MSDLPDDNGDSNEENETAADLVRKGLANLPRDDEDAVQGALLVEYVAQRLPDPDVAAIKRSQAQSAIKRQRQHHTTQVDGQLSFDDLGTWDYEPDRLILAGNGTLVEQQRAHARHKADEAARTGEKAAQAQMQSQRRYAESAAFNIWQIDQLRAGVDYKELTFGTFVTWMRRAAS